MFSIGILSPRSKFHVLNISLVHVYLLKVNKCSCSYSYFFNVPLNSGTFYPLFYMSKLLRVEQVSKANEIITFDLVVLSESLLSRKFFSKGTKLNSFQTNRYCSVA